MARHMVTGASNLSGMDPAACLFLWDHVDRIARRCSPRRVPCRSLVPHMARHAPVGTSACGPLVVPHHGRRLERFSSRCRRLLNRPLRSAGLGQMVLLLLPAGAAGLLTGFILSSVHIQLAAGSCLLVTLALCGWNLVPHLEPSWSARFGRHRSSPDSPVPPVHHDAHRHGGRHQCIMDTAGHALRHPSSGRLHPYGIHWVSAAGDRRWIVLCLAPRSWLHNA